jgi:prepilin-type N-terminal cleavage/methylation domain-containing protein
MSEFTSRGRRGGFTLVEIMVVVFIIGILLAIAVPSFVKAREKTHAQACLANLKEIDTAILQWAMHNKKTDAYPVAMADLTGGADPYLSTPACPSGGVYTVTTVGENPTCSIGGTHAIP